MFSKFRSIFCCREENKRLKEENTKLREDLKTLDFIMEENKKQIDYCMQENIKMENTIKDLEEKLAKKSRGKKMVKKEDVTEDNDANDIIKAGRVVGSSTESKDE